MYRRRKASASEMRRVLAEQVSHHPPLCAYITEGESGYVREMNFQSKMKFSKGNLTLYNVFPEYIELKPFKERFLLQ